jgi:eukaryotic-like serine/threonine-protein kinase
MGSTTPVPTPPATRLKGLTLASGWVVTDEIQRLPGGTGGHFSCGYKVKKNGQSAFLKALDYSKVQELALAMGTDTLTALQVLVNAYQFERNLLRDCKQKRMDRVVIALEDGSVQVDPGPFGEVNYLIFEQAQSDVRTHLALFQDLNLIWILKCLHHIATGLYQLHSAKVAHQDLKPSNVLVFDANLSKIADLGCASIQGTVCPRDDFEFAGDSTYAPPELLYGSLDLDWGRRRQAADVYHLGSMVTFLFGGTSMTAMILANMPADHLYTVWAGTYSEVLAEIRNAFDIALEEFSRNVPGEQLRKALREAVSQLCDPEPTRRGHPSNRQGFANPYSLERYVNLFNLLSQRAAIGILEKK